MVEVHLSRQAILQKAHLSLSFPTEPHLCTHANAAPTRAYTPVLLGFATFQSAGYSMLRETRVAQSQG